MKIGVIGNEPAGPVLAKAWANAGHEMIGVVEMVGDGVKDFKPGDFVVCPFEFSDNTCVNCKNGITGSCINGGFFPALNGDGGQGEYVRVPLADGSLVKVEGLEFNDANLASLLALSDVMSTGYHAAICARVKQGDTVVVVGDGAVGLCGIIAAKMLGAARVIAMSKYEPRQKLAREFGATDVIAERGDEAIKKVIFSYKIRHFEQQSKPNRQANPMR